MTIQVTGSTWKCPQCAQINELRDERCPKCDAANSYWNADTVGANGSRSARRTVDPVIVLAAAVIILAFALLFAVAAPHAQGSTTAQGLGASRASLFTDVGGGLALVGLGMLPVGIAGLIDKRRMRRAS